MTRDTQLQPNVALITLIPKFTLKCLALELGISVPITLCLQLVHSSVI